MLCANDIVLFEESREVNSKFEFQRQTLECFHLSKKSDLGEKIRDIIQQVFKIKYVGSIVQNDRKINDVTHWMIEINFLKNGTKGYQ